MSLNQDLQVETFSDALSGIEIDLLVSGSIAAIETPRLVRALRRIGASVHVSMTPCASAFIGVQALEWASTHRVLQNFDGLAPHISTRDLCVLAPASANSIRKIAQGSCEDLVSSLACSYLGSKKPVFVLANMHESLFNSPMVQENLAKLEDYCHLLGSRNEEGKLKFPPPDILADEIAHHFHAHHKKYPGVLVSMGSTKGYIDEVRYISNYSSGSLGSKISEELYRYGFPTFVAAGSSNIKPRSYTKLYPVETNEELASACSKALKEDGAKAAILAASVLDFAPSETRSGKISSYEQLSVEFKKMPKLIAAIHPSSGIKVGFKLEAELTEQKAYRIAEEYLGRYTLSHMVINALSEVDANKHRAYVFSRKNDSLVHQEIDGKQAIAQKLVSEIIAAL